LQIYIEGNQERARADDSRAGTFVQLWITDIWRTIRIDFNFPTQPFEASAAVVFQPDPLRTQRGALIKVDGN
jgi:hypothetical protein